MGSTKIDIYEITEPISAIPHMRVMAGIRRAIEITRY
jgi:hypothetical protein